MVTSIEDEGNETLELTDQSGKIRKVYMKYSGSETIFYSRDELRNTSYKNALKDLQEWLQKYSKDAEVADLRKDVSALVDKVKKA